MDSKRNWNMRAILAALTLAALIPSAGLAQRTQLIAVPTLMQVEGDERPVELESALLTVEPAAGMARTTIEMEFRNPNSRVLEGNLQFPLQPGQQVVGFALDVGGRMREAVPVEKERGRQVFEAIEREGVDPGLLEQTQGEFFRLRVYPFAPGGTRRVRVELVEPLKQIEGASAVTLPLAFAARLENLELRARSAQAPRVDGVPGNPKAAPASAGLHRFVLSRASIGSSRGVTLLFPSSPAPAVQVQSHGGERYFVAEVPVDVKSRPRALPARIGLVWDSSMSGAKRAHDLELALLDRYFASARTLDVDLIRLRNVAEPARRFRIEGGNWSELRRELESTVYDGATSTDGWAPDASVPEYLLFSDGLFNYGQAPFPGFGAGQRLYAVQAGAAGDSTRLAGLAHARHGRLVRLDSRKDLDDAARDLLHEQTRLVAV
ncbi:VIT domain-containing protein [Lysobacter korlensis]|uniref:VIT domain-containing protein n=1 Tax=Lysobacter korlensis TaxID=553636 RepID=A0ABV6S0K9_9GAMM